MIPGYEKLRDSRYFGKSNILYARFDKHTYTDSRRTQERTELVQPDRRPPQTANGKGQTSTVDGIHQTPYLSSFERTIGATLIIPARRSFSRFVCAASLPLSPLQVLFGPL